MADRDYTGQAIGIFELDGLLACYVALDAAAKAAALDAALAAAEGLGKVTASTVIPAPAAGTEYSIAMTIGK